MSDGREPGQHQHAARPDWAAEPGDALGNMHARRRRPRPVPPSVPRGGDGLWTHVLETSAVVAVLTWVAAIALPHAVPVWMVNTTMATAAVVIGLIVHSQTASAAMTAYMFTWGAVLTGWMTAARITSPWAKPVIFSLLLPVLVLGLIGVPVIRSYRDRVKRVSDAGRDPRNIAECQHWADLLHRYGAGGVAVKDVIHVEGGYQVWCRHRKVGPDGGRPVSDEAIRNLVLPLTRHKRLERGSVYIEEEPPGQSAADFIIHVKSEKGPRLARYLPADNSFLSINAKFPVGVFDTGREFALKLREVVMFIVGVRGSGKSTLLNVFIAQLCRMPDALIFMIDLKGGQEARMWLMPWLMGWTDRPAIDWLATTRQEAEIMLDALWRAGNARAESGKHGRKLRPSRDYPAIIVICDETAVMTGHGLREDGLSNTKLATKLLQIAETFRSVAIDPVVAAVRAVVDVTGNSGLKAMSEYKIGMRVGTIGEGQAIFPDDYPAAAQLAKLKDKGTGIPKLGAQLFPPVHFFNITDGSNDDDDRPTEDRITPVVLATAGRRPAPEPELVAAMGEAYAKRWKQPHIAKLCQTWLDEAGSSLPPEPGDVLVADEPRDEHDDVAAHGSPPPARPGFQPGRGKLSDAERQLLGDIEAHFGEEGEEGTLSGGGSGAVYDPRSDDEDGQRLNPDRKRMRELLIERGQIGYKAGTLWGMLLNEGRTIARQTVHDWLAQDEKLGYVRRTGKPRNRWYWALPPGREYDIPGMGG